MRSVTMLLLHQTGSVRVGEVVRYVLIQQADPAGRSSRADPAGRPSRRTQQADRPLELETPLSWHHAEHPRYTLTYTPSADRILPAPKFLYVKIKNTSAIPLRAAYLHGPYTLYCACYPLTFHPNTKHERVNDEGTPEYEPQLKAGGHWNAKL